MSIVTDVMGARKGTPGTTGQAQTSTSSSSTTTGTNPTGDVTKAVGATPGAVIDTSWHVVVLWFLGAVALIALAEPAPQVATMIVVLLILGTLLNNWPVYRTYLGLPGNAGNAATATKG